jgi:hypothetical protein
MKRLTIQSQGYEYEIVYVGMASELTQGQVGAYLDGQVRSRPKIT